MKHLAIDIGAESGRGILGWLDDGKLKIREIHRFQNAPVEEGGVLKWDISAILNNVYGCIGKAGPGLDSVGVDTWAVDFVLLDHRLRPLDKPYHYRDTGTRGVMERTFQVTTKATIYEQTGIQFLPFNTLYQLLSKPPELLREASVFLTIPDYINYTLTGGQSIACEFTNATTTQCYNPRLREWASTLLNSLNLPIAIFPQIVQPGTQIGKLLGHRIDVIAVASHDTASAVAGIPLEKNSAWLSSGTWSILGLEVAEPIISQAALEGNFTNEGGVDRTFRFSRNIAGLWLLQQCRLAWGGGDSYEELTEMAEAAEPLDQTVDPDSSGFFEPGDMPARICEGLALEPHEKGKVVRLILESLAQKYAEVLKQAIDISGAHVERLHIVGGGCKNRLLNQLTANACGMPVVAGPVEATAIGNLTVQMVAIGEIQSIARARDVIRASFPTETFYPCTRT